MTDQQTPEIDEDDIPPINFDLRNMQGDSGEIELRQRMLGLEPYILIKSDEDGPLVEGSHTSFEGVAQILAFILVAILQSDEITPEARAELLDFLKEGA